MMNRRELIKWLGAAIALTKLPACGSSGDHVFTADQLAMLNGFADVIIPPDQDPGGSQLGVVPYIERLLTAFSATGTPPIYAGGPYSDRNPLPGGAAPENDFETFVELDRVLLYAWQVQLLGSAGIPGGAPNDALIGPVIALKDQLTTGLDMAQQLVKGTPDYQTVFDSMPADFQELVFELVTQAAWAAPEYGGNPGLAGWRMVHFEGDSLPLGYTQWNGVGYEERSESPMSTPNLTDPAPLTPEVESLLADVTNVLGGQVSNTND